MEFYPPTAHWLIATIAGLALLGTIGSAFWGLLLGLVVLKVLPAR